MLNLFALERYRRAEIVDRETGVIIMVLKRRTDGGIDTDFSHTGELSENYGWRDKLAMKLQKVKRRA